MFSLNFTVNPLAAVGKSTEFDWDEEETIINTGEPVPTLTNGCLVAGAGCPWAIGDVDRDGNAGEAFDSLQIMSAITNIPTVYDPIPLCVADTNCSGFVSLIDAVLVLQRAVRLIDGYCHGASGGRGAGDVGGRSVARAPGTFDIEVQTPVEINQGEPFDIIISLTDLPFDPVYGYSFELNYDPASIIFEGFSDQENTITRRWGDPLFNDELGRLTFTHLNAWSPISELGPLVKLRAHPATDTSITFTNFILAENTEPNQDFGPYEVNFIGGPCYSATQYDQAIENWNQNDTNILTLISMLSCLDETR